MKKILILLAFALSISLNTIGQTITNCEMPQSFKEEKSMSLAKDITKGSNQTTTQTQVENSVLMEDGFEVPLGTEFSAENGSFIPCSN